MVAWHRMNPIPAGATWCAIVIATTTCSSNHAPRSGLRDPVAAQGVARPVAPDDVGQRVAEVFASMTATAAERGLEPSEGVTLHRVGEERGRYRSFCFETSAVPTRCATGGLLRGTRIDLDLVSRSVVPLFSAYGLDASRGYVAHDRIDDAEICAVLEFVSLDDGIGIEILDEGWEPVLDEREWQTLRGRGVEVFVAERIYADGTDVRTANACVLLGLVEYLNDRTDGPDVSIEWFVDAVGAHLELNAGSLRPMDSKANDPSVFEVIDGALSPGESMVVAGSATRFAVDVGPSTIASRRIEYRLRKSPRRDLGVADESSTTGSCILDLSTDPPLAAVRIVAPGEPSSGELHFDSTLESHSRTHRVADGFDPSRPFRIEFDAPGEAFRFVRAIRILRAE